MCVLRAIQGLARIESGSELLGPRFGTNFAEKNWGFGGGRTHIMVMILREEVKNNISSSMV
jgi:hypothetical protein